MGHFRESSGSAEPRSHNAVVAAVGQGRADWGIAIAPAARAAGLGFLPLQEEDYDFVVPRNRLSREPVQAFKALLGREDGRAALVWLGFVQRAGAIRSSIGLEA
jgi:putative molybdopterin biosynthesis protein